MIYCLYFHYPYTSGICAVCLGQKLSLLSESLNRSDLFVLGNFVDLDIDGLVNEPLCTIFIAVVCR